jgi:hypothetical protein
MSYVVTATAEQNNGRKKYRKKTREIVRRPQRRERKRERERGRERGEREGRAAAAAAAAAFAARAVERPRVGHHLPPQPRPLPFVGGVEAHDSEGGAPALELGHPGGEHREGAHHQVGAGRVALVLQVRKQADGLQRLAQACAKRGRREKQKTWNF